MEGWAGCVDCVEGRVSIREVLAGSRNQLSAMRIDTWLSFVGAGCRGGLTCCPPPDRTGKGCGRGGDYGEVTW
jgi:hypothetical protein